MLCINNCSNFINIISIYKKKKCGAKEEEKNWKNSKFGWLSFVCVCVCVSKEKPKTFFVYDKKVQRLSGAYHRLTIYTSISSNRTVIFVILFFFLFHFDIKYVSCMRMSLLYNINVNSPKGWCFFSFIFFPFFLV